MYCGYYEINAVPVEFQGHSKVGAEMISVPREWSQYQDSGDLMGDQILPKS